LSICSLAIGKLNAASDWQSALAADCETAQRQFTAANYMLGIGVRAGKFWAVERLFARIFTNLPELFLCDFSREIFSHKDHEDLFLV